MIQKIISGGQSGVDRAALDVALELGISCGGWCPRGRLAEDGLIADRYPLRETPTEIHAQRTEWNVRDSDGTLIVTRGRPTEGTALTISIAARLRRPHFVLDLAASPDLSGARTWMRQHEIRTLNVAGPRESKCPGIYAAAAELLRQLFNQRSSQDP
jgi:hypothetical protein